MRELMSSFLSNDSAFGRAMTWCGVVIAANIMFFVFSIPVITTGASYAALEFTMMRAERSGGQINPFKEFWKGFKTNWKQSTITFVIGALAAAFLYVDIRIASQAGGAVAAFRIPLTALLIAEISVLIWLFPVMAAFQDRLPRLFTNSIYFAIRRIWALPILLFFHIFPFYLSYTDVQMQPLYAFIWAFFGFACIALLDAKLMIPVFAPYLPRVDEYGDMVLEPEEDGIDAMLAGIEAADGDAADAGRKGGTAPGQSSSGSAQKSEKEILEEMQKLGM